MKKKNQENLKERKQKKERAEDNFTISAKEYAALDEHKRAEWSPVKAKYEKLPKICFAAYGLAGLSVIIYIIACISPAFADFYNLHVGSAFRTVFATVSGLIPFSIAELIIILSPVIIFIAGWYLTKFRCETQKSATVAILCILAAGSVFFSAFITNLGIAYRGTTLDQKLGIESAPVSADELYEATLYLSEKINELEPEIHYDANNFSIMPYSFKEMNEKLIDAYDKFTESNKFIKNFNSRLKPVMLSEAMSYTHVTGVYTFFTGESNINVNFPDYTVPFTAAHELAHQRGIAREDEANMIAFLVCIGSDDVYIRYSAYMNMYEYMASALYSADKALYKKAARNLIIDAENEMIAYGDFFEKYEKSVVSKVTGTVNDAYLKVQGTAGRVSYGMVVDLTVAFLKSENLIEIETSQN